MQNKIKNPLFYGENRIAAHSDHKYYVSEAEFVQQIQSLKKSLDGVWKFHYAKNMAEAPDGFYKNDTDCRNWADIHVPAHIQLEGYDKPSMSMCSIRGTDMRSLNPARFQRASIPQQAMSSISQYRHSLSGNGSFSLFRASRAASHSGVTAAISATARTALHRQNLS